MKFGCVMVYLSGGRGATVVDNGDAYYEREFDVLADRMRHALNDDMRYYYLGKFKEEHQHALYVLTAERMERLRLRLIREVGPGVIRMVDDVFPDELVVEIQWLVNDMANDTFDVIVQRMVSFKRKHNLRGDDALRFQEVLYDRYPPDERCSEEFLRYMQRLLEFTHLPHFLRYHEFAYAFQEVFPEVREGHRLDSSEFYQWISKLLVLYNRREVIDVFTCLKTECHFNKERAGRLRAALERMYGGMDFLPSYMWQPKFEHKRFAEFMEAFEAVFPDCREV
jgi:hypothetical protein